MLFIHRPRRRPPDIGLGNSLMALRCLLVSLVASLGFDLPSNRDVTSWKVMGRDWYAARAIDLSAMGAEASGWLGANDPTMKPSAALAETPAPPAAMAMAMASGPDESIRRRDLAFDAVGEELAAALAADRRLLAEANPVPTPVADAPAIEVVVLAPAEPPCRPEAVADDLAFPVPDAADTADEADDAGEETPAPPGRLASAVRLTRDAVQAWTALVQGMGGEIRVR